MWFPFDLFSRLSTLIFSIFFHDCEVIDDIPTLLLLERLASASHADFLLHLFLMFLFLLPLVLDEGDSQYFDDNWYVVQSLHKPKSICIRDIDLEHLADQAHLVCKGYKDLRLVEMFLEVLHEQILELWEHCIEHVNHQEKYFEGNVLPIFIMFNYIRIIEIFF